MGKSILVINAPRTCTECPLFIDAYNDMTCRGNGRTIDYPYPNDKAQSWCPLREIPQKKPEKSMGEWLAFNNGYNACIDEILKEDN